MVTQTKSAFSGAPSKPLGITKALQSRIVKHLKRAKPAPVSLGTGAGQEIVAQPPTIIPPPSAVAAVTQQLDSSTQLAENTATGKGIGAGRTSAPVTKRVLNSNAYIILAALGAALLLAFAFDRGKL
jgi:hypothetical protein